MHISEGVVSIPVLVSGAVFALGGLSYSLRRLPWSHIMSVGILSAAFFVASLIRIPLGPGSVHLIMNGLLGAILGWAALPAITVALFLQALLFQFGGLTSLGVNICIMAFPAVACGMCFRRFFTRRDTIPTIPAFFCGSLAVLFSSLICAVALALSGEAFLMTAWTIVFAHLPIMAIEGTLTAVIVKHLAKALPDILHMNQNMQKDTPA